MPKKLKCRHNIINFSLTDWVYIILNDYSIKKKPSHASERVEYAFQYMKDKNINIDMFKMYYGDKKTYIEIAIYHGISKSMAYRYVHSVEEAIRKDKDVQYILLHTISESQKHLEKKNDLMRNDIWPYDVIEKLGNDETPFKEICENAKNKYHRLEIFFGKNFTVSDIVRASNDDYLLIKGFGEKTKMMVIVSVWKYYNNRVKQEM